jgi:uncharacterized protein (TIGR02996 family)
MRTAYADAFLADIRENPADDGPRLIFADWLEERDGPGDAERAEFIRLQVELARLPAGHPQRGELEARERALRQQCGARWSAPLAGLVRGLEFRRGFVEWVRLDAAALTARADELFRLAPLRHLDLYLDAEQGEAVADCPYLSRLDALDVYSPDGAGLTPLLASPHLAGLRSLRLRNPGAEGLGALLAACLPELSVLRLNTGSLGDTEVRRLAAAPLLGQLAGLDLSINAVGPAGAEALACSPHLGRLGCLWLGFNHLGNNGAEALAQRPWRALTRLYLARNYLGSAAVEALVRAPLLERLTHLDLDYNDLPAAALHGLLESPHLTRLQTLFLRCSRGVPARLRQRLERRFGPGVCRF